MDRNKRIYIPPEMDVKVAFIDESIAVNSVLYEPNTSVDVEWIEDEEDERFVEW